MARRRMFSLELISSDKFLGLAATAQSFYFHMGMHADDEGFVSAPNSLALLCKGSQQDLDELEQKGYIIRFDSGVLVIVDWMLNNTIRKERSVETIHRTEKAMLTLVNGRYALKKAEQAAPVNVTLVPAELAATGEEKTESVVNSEPAAVLADASLPDYAPEFDYTMEEYVSMDLSPKMSPKTDVIFSANSAPQNRREENRAENNIIDNNSQEHSTQGEKTLPKADRADRFADLQEEIRESDRGNTYTHNRCPTCRDIFDFCSDAGLRHVSVTEFWSYYMNTGWTDQNGEPIRDWKALAKAWNRRARQISESKNSGWAL